MSTWNVAIDLTRQDAAANRGPVFVRIARAITEDIRRGRLRAGDALPGTRTLAASLGGHRNTVLAAYRELAAEGWIDSAEARGTFVAVEIPDVQPKRFAPSAAPIREVAAKAGYEIHPIPPSEEQRRALDTQLG